jgi:3-phenylpropionate/trans-cinnamate dioxygenase ferredoxin reductase component
MRLERIVVVGGSIAAATAAGALRSEGFDGEVLVVSEERDPPYSRVPLSKGVLSGAQAPETARLPALDPSIEVLLGRRAVGLDSAAKFVGLDDGAKLTFDGLVVATGARPIRLARPGQHGELVVRTLSDAAALAERVRCAATAVVVGGGFLGMEVASTLMGLGLDVTLVDRDPPLRRLLGTWLADHVVGLATKKGLRVIHGAGDVTLLGTQIEAVQLGDGRRLAADVVISAVGDVPATDWLASSGLPLRGGLVMDACCRVAPAIVAAGDVATVRDQGGRLTRSPHWTSAVEQGYAAARSLLDPEGVSPVQPNAYFWTEQFGFDIKIAGHVPASGAPEVVEGDPAENSALLRWRSPGGGVAAAVAVNHRIPVVKLKKLRAAPAI